MQVSWFLTSRSLLLSIMLHVVLGGILIFSFEFSPKPTPPPKSTVNIVKATSVDKKKVEQELNRLKDKENKKKAEEIKQKKELEELKKQRKKEEEKLKQIKKKKEQQEKKRKEEEAREKKLEKEKKELEKKAKLEQEKKKKAEEERKKLEEQKKKEAERKKKEAEEKRKADEERKRKEQEKALQEELDAELEAEQEKRDLAEIDRYRNAISRAIREEFITTGLPEDLSCIILIRMLEGGKVADVSIVQSSGNSLFDKRAENAVYSASPLPAPDEERLFKKMRTIEFIFKP